MTRIAHWIMTADERHATLYSCQKVAGARWHIELHKAMENRWEDYRDHGRPSALGRGPTANAAQHFASLGHEEEEEHLRFAREVGDWLAHATKELGVDHISIFAAPKFLGLLRGELGRLNKKAELHEAELTRLRPSELVNHPAIVKALNLHEEAEQAGR